jgi:hypothetical protein
MSTQDELNKLKKEYELNKLKVILEGEKNNPLSDPWKISVLEKNIDRLENNIAVTPQMRLVDLKEQLDYFLKKGDVPAPAITALRDTIAHFENIVKIK